MKKIVIIVICLLFALSVTGCGRYCCQLCENETLDVKETEDGYYCYECIIDNEYEKCIECDVYYEADGWSCSNRYCHNCFDFQGKMCSLCWYYFDEDINESNGEYYWYECIINAECERCFECGGYYVMDGENHSEVCCRSCLEKKGEYCFLCGLGLSSYEMISLEMGSERTFICPDCATEYFANVEPIIPVDYCIECWHLYPLGDFHYEHYDYNESLICQECLVECGYEK